MGKVDLIKRNCVEIINEEKISSFSKKGIVYCGYECSGEIHLGHLVTILKLKDLQKAGIKVKILLADWHTWLNKKGDWKFVNRMLAQWEKGFKALGLETEIVKGTSFQKSPDYFEDVLKLALNLTVSRGVRAMQQVARDIENAKISQIIYPLMQVEDVKKLKVNFVLGGLDQRKIYMMGIDQGKDVGLQECVYLFTPLLPGLKGPETKMSSSFPNSFISVRDSKDLIKKKISKAYCPQGIEGNSVFSFFEKIEIKRDKKFGGNVVYENYKSLEKDFANKKIHPADLKNFVAECLEKIVAPIREGWKI